MHFLSLDYCSNIFLATIHLFILVTKCLLVNFMINLQVSYCTFEIVSGCLSVKSIYEKWMVIQMM